MLVANDPGFLTGALLCGEGLMLCSDVLIKGIVEQGLVRHALAGWTGPEYDCSAVFPKGRVQSPKVRAFVDFLVERLTFDADYVQTVCPAKRALAAEQAEVAKALAKTVVAEAEARIAALASA